MIPRSCPVDPAFIDATENGGGERDRTDDLLLAKQALYQLSYTPVEGSAASLPAVKGVL